MAGLLARPGLSIYDRSVAPFGPHPAPSADEREAHLDARTLQLWAAHECKGAAFAEVATVGAAIGAPLLPVKGVLTSRTLYANPTEREMVDVDVRVLPGDLTRLCVAGEARGWVRLERSRAYAAAAFEVLGERVELEAHVGPPGFCRLSVATMVARASTHVEPFGVVHLQPELHDHALLLVVNAFKDQLIAASEGGLVDLARMAALPHFSFPLLAERAHESGIAALTWLVAEWMIEQRREERWRALLHALGGRSKRPLHAALFRALARREASPSLALRLLVRAAPDTLQMQARASLTTLAWWLETAMVSPSLALSRIATRGG